MIKQHRIALAENEVEAARARLIDTVGDFAGLLEPRKIMSEVWESAKVKGADLAEDAVDAVKKRPVMVGGIIAAVTAFLAREPLKDAAVMAYDAMTSDKKTKGEKKKATASAPAPDLEPATAKRRSRAKPRTAATVEK